MLPKMNIYFKGDGFFGLLQCYQQAGKQNNSDTIIWLPGFCILYWTTYTTLYCGFKT